MHILIVDDEKLILTALRESVEEVLPGQAISCFDNGEDALAHARDNPADIALLDVGLGGMSGVDLALQLKKQNGKTNIIFVTGYADYMGNAFSMHASGYILKPAKTEDIARELHNLRYPPPITPPGPVRVQCFGNFEVYVNEERLPFTRSKAKELLAYLVYKNGASVSKKEVAAVLWEDRPYTRSLQHQIQKIITLLLRILREAGVEELIVRHWGRIAVDTGMYTSDYADFLDGDVRALNAYHGEYMAEYSWAEFTTGILTRIAQNKND